MGWLNKIFKGSVNRVSRGHYDGHWHEGNQSEHTRDAYDESDSEDIARAIALSLAEQDPNKGKAIDPDYSLEEDEQLARALQESLNTESPPHQNAPVENVPTESIPAREPHQHVLPSSGFRTCAGCRKPIGHGRFLSCMDEVWHPQCFKCYACNKPISEYEFAMHEDQPYHKSCYKDFFHPKCDVCKNFIPTNKNGLIEYRAHPFWMQKYCPSHEDDGTPRCCSCERMEPTDIKYITLDDGRKLCLECLTSATMDSPECQHLYMDIQEFFEGLNMKVEQQVPLLLVERQALNEALEAEKSGHHLPETRGLCLSEEQIVRTILKRPTIGPGNRIMDMITGPYKLVRRCEVTAILILYGLPRLQTGSILAHEMMHAYLRLKGTCSHAHKFLVGFTCIPILFSASPSFFLQDTDPLALRLKKASVKSYPTCGLSLKSSPVL
uniref:LIM zinc-binding domain-containing protein n=1 Tax=Aegilops tauschii subsp. strangulata TaxID=200361 RepID=A0A453JSF9_AEGTS